MKAYWGSGGISPRILDLGTRWRWVDTTLDYAETRMICSQKSSDEIITGWTKKYPKIITFSWLSVRTLFPHALLLFSQRGVASLSTLHALITLLSRKPAKVGEIHGPVKFGVQTGSGAHPTSYPMGTGAFYPGVKTPGVWSWHLPTIYCQY